MEERGADAKTSSVNVYEVCLLRHNRSQSVYFKSINRQDDVGVLSWAACATPGTVMRAVINWI